MVKPRTRIDTQHDPDALPGHHPRRTKKCQHDGCAERTTFVLCDRWLCRRHLPMYRVGLNHCGELVAHQRKDEES